jgi:hypothetical protein
MIGVTALVYTIAHIIIYFALRLWNFSFIANEMMTRLTLIVATLSTIGLIALGSTSLDAAAVAWLVSGAVRDERRIPLAHDLARVEPLSPGRGPVDAGFSRRGNILLRSDARSVVCLAQARLRILLDAYE